MKWKCPYGGCPHENKIYGSREDAKEHLRQYHQDKIEHVLSGVDTECMTCDPVNWTTGFIVGMTKLEE